MLSAAEMVRMQVAARGPCDKNHPPFADKERHLMNILVGRYFLPTKDTLRAPPIAMENLDISPTAPT